MLKGTVTLLSLSGVPVRIHWTFLILLAWVFGAGAIEGGSWRTGAVSLALVVAIFVCVVAHEFGHILTARAFGIRTRDVTLLPIGGIATLERMPGRPWQELVVALAGPLVNVVIAVALLPGLFWAGSLDPSAQIAQPASSPAGFLASVAVINIWLVVFNLIPAFPMDGGRMLRALLAIRTDRVTATRAAVIVGQVLAVAMALVGVFAGLPMLLILSIFIFISAGAEGAATQAQEFLRGLHASDVMVRSFRVLGESDTLATAANELLANSQTDFPVTRDGTDRSPVVGLLTRSDLIRGLAHMGPAATVREAMRPPCPVADLDEPAPEVIQRLHRTVCPLIPVVHQKLVVGLLTVENISEVVLVRGALRRGGAPPAT
jgi:Zn-dependent protease